MKDTVMLNKDEQRIYTLASDVLYQKLTIKEFSILSGKSYRQAQRIVKKVKNKGFLGVKHGNLGKTPSNKIEIRTQSYVMDILKRYYFDYNLTHFSEVLKTKYNISIKRETLRKWATKENMVKNRQRRPNKRVHKIRPRMPQEGLLVQFDGSEHAWFGGKRSIYTLIGGIDDATGEILYLEFFPGEDTFNCMKAMKGIILNKGIPKAFYLDKAGHFGKPYTEQNRTQIGRALEELDCKVLLASTSQAKGRIERLWKTLQDRLVAELRFEGITKVRPANEYIQKTFIPNFNKQFTVPPRVAESAYSKRPSKAYLEKVFCIKEQRRIGSGNVFSYENSKYQLKFNENVRYRYITVLNHENGNIEFELYGQRVEAYKFETEITDKKTILKIVA